MKIETISGTVLVVFKERPYDEDSIGIETICEIYFHDHLVNKANAIQNPCDRYNEVLGKKIALERAIQGWIDLPMECLFTFPQIIRSKLTRSLIWAKFWQMFPIEKLRTRS